MYSWQKMLSANAMLLKTIRIFSASSRQLQIVAPALSFKSAISLDKIYPNSSLNIAKEVKIPSNEEKFSGYIPLDRVQITYMRSSGPGGQNVNKSNSKVDVRFLLSEATWLPQSLRDNIEQKHRHLLTDSGYLVIRSEKTRSQQLNLADSLDKLRGVLHSATLPPPQLPDHYTIEIRRRRHEKAVRERLRAKRQRSYDCQFRGAQ